MANGERRTANAPGSNGVVDETLQLDWVMPLLDQAGQIALRMFRTAMVPDDKAAGGPAGYDPVTEADRDIEKLLRSRLSERYPDHQIVGEEAGVSGPDGRYRWLIDPIDGTKSFVTGSPLWGILVGLIEDGRPIAGWMHQPYIGETFASVGGTATITRGDERRTLATRQGVGIAESVMYTTFPGMFTADDDRDAFARLTRAVRLTRFGGDCYAYCQLAMGHVDLVVEASLQPYDIVPLIPIVEGAGGVVTGRHGEPPVDGGFVIAAASRAIHEQALSVIEANGSNQRVRS